MEFEFASRIESLKPSAIREILKYSSDPSVIAFSAGNPAADSFPLWDIRVYAEDILANDGVRALQYGVTEGFEPLREDLKFLCRNRYSAFDEARDELIVTTGGQQAIELASKVLLNEGDTVVAEGPSFVGALNCFKSYGAKILQPELSENGIDLDELESILKSTENVKLIYLIPNFQNPSGLTTPLKTRLGALELAKKYNVLIIEDNPYGELRFSGEEVPNIKSFDDTGNVLYVGSLSKVLSPGMRVGYVSGAKELVEKMTVAKQVADVHTPCLNQMIAHMFLNEIDFETHVERIREIYGRKCALMLECLDREAGGAFSYTRPEGGLFIWCTLPDGADMMDFCRRAVEKKLAVVPGTAFYADDDSKTSSFRINFSSPSDENIIKGVKIMCDTAKGM